MREIKSQITRCNDRSSLFYVRAEYFFKRRVNEVRGSVISSRRVAFLLVDDRRNRVANLERASFYPGFVKDDARDR